VGDADAHLAVRVVAAACAAGAVAAQRQLQAHGFVGVAQQRRQAEEVGMARGDGAHLEVRVAR
jgi:hypothetical protein